MKKPTVYIKRIKGINYQVYFNNVARKVFPYERVKIDSRTLTIREPSQFEPSNKITHSGNVSWSSSLDIEGTYLLEKEDDIFYLTLIKE